MVWLIRLLLNTFVILLLVRIVFSWIRVSPDSALRPVVNMVYQLTEPVLAPVRNVLPSTGGFDFSPMVVFLAITVIRNVIL